MAYLALVSSAFLLCSGIFWGITCASIALVNNLRNPLRHLATGAFLQLIGFIIVVALVVMSKRKAKRLHKTHLEPIVAHSSITSADQW